MRLTKFDQDSASALFKTRFQRLLKAVGGKRDKKRAEGRSRMLSEMVELRKKKRKD